MNEAPANRLLADLGAEVIENTRAVLEGLKGVQ
jgi:hypothetical protein